MINLEEVKEAIEQWFITLGYDNKERAEKQYLKIIAEVERLQKAIEEENKIKVGDWCLRTDDCIFKVSGNDLNWARNHSEKITDQELINKLNGLIK